MRGMKFLISFVPAIYLTTGVVAQPGPQAPTQDQQYWASDWSSGTLGESVLSTLLIPRNPAPPGACPQGAFAPTLGAFFSTAGGLNPQDGIAYEYLRRIVYTVSGSAPGSGSIIVFPAGAGFGYTNFATASGVPGSVTMIPFPTTTQAPMCPKFQGECIAVAEHIAGGGTSSAFVNVYNVYFVPPVMCLQLVSSFNVSALQNMSGARIDHIYATAAGVVGGVLTLAGGTGDSFLLAVNCSTGVPQLIAGPTLLHTSNLNLQNESIVYDPVNVLFWTAATSRAQGFEHTGGRLWTWVPAPGSNPTQVSVGTVTGGVFLAPDPNVPFPLNPTPPVSCSGPGQCRRGVLLLEQWWNGIAGGATLHRIGWDTGTGGPFLDWSSTSSTQPGNVRYMSVPGPQEGFVQGPIAADLDGNFMCGVLDTRWGNGQCMQQAWGPGVVQIDRCGNWLAPGSPGSPAAQPVWLGQSAATRFCPTAFPKGDGGRGWETQKGFVVL